MTINDRDDIARRMEAIGLAGGNADAGHPDLPRDPWQPRWALDKNGKWITFECGCVAERCTQLFGPAPYDPIIFEGLPQQAVYHSVCARHLPGMNKYVAFSGRYKDFATWGLARRKTLMNRTTTK